VDESGVIKTQTRMNNRSENDRSAWDALYNTTRNSNQYPTINNSDERYMNSEM
jgi:hypothetical protein